ncbi:MAG: hypothetical protein JRI95_04115 [Deltaproteobacteria bacterium]|nr:hypothetical protein [Deltaproteobacteria bacterium]MBW2085139.1 hypothetical protein [Deltaproteobacteria bacterium]
MVYAGCDLGTVTAKMVLLENDTILDFETLAYKNLPKQAAVEVMEKALSRASLSQDQIEHTIATGFGRKTIPFSDGDAPEVICLNRAIQWLHPEVRTVIDAGGQSIRAFNIGDNGKITDSTTNEKCAAGTGKFVEVMAKALELPLDQISQLSFDAKDPVSITSQCGVFAESEVITYVNEGKDRADIIAGINRSVAGKVSSLVRRISLIEQVALVGGVAKNSGVVKYVEEELGLKLTKIEPDPQILGALGAALLAKERHNPSN